MALLLTPNLSFAESKPKLWNLTGRLLKRSLEVERDIAVSSKTIAEMRRSQLQARIQSGGDLSDMVGRDSDEICLGMLQEGVVRLEGELSLLTVVTALADHAVAPADRKQAIQFARVGAEDAKSLVSHAREAASTASGTCPQSVIVNQKSQSVLALAADTETALDQILLDTKDADGK